MSPRGERSGRVRSCRHPCGQSPWRPNFRPSVTKMKRMGSRRRPPRWRRPWPRPNLTRVCRLCRSPLLPFRPDLRYSRNRRPWIAWRSSRGRRNSRIQRNLVPREPGFSRPPFPARRSARSTGGRPRPEAYQASRPRRCPPLRKRRRWRGPMHPGRPRHVQGRSYGPSPRRLRVSVSLLRPRWLLLDRLFLDSGLGSPLRGRKR